MTTADLRRYIGHAIDAGKRVEVLHVNVHGLNLASQLDWYRDYLNRAPVVFCDGAGVLQAARFLGYDLPERITYADWMWELAETMARRGWRLFLLGGQPGIAARAAQRLTARFPDLRISGIQHGYFEKAVGSPENESVISQINAAQPHILVVGFGMPLQERWLMENRDRIHANVALTGGAVFDYVSGTLRRAPRWMTENSLEWLGRLLIEPRRLWRRYLLGNPLFILRVLKQRLTR